MVTLRPYVAAMPGTYALSVDIERSLVFIELHGFFTPEEIAVFDQDRRAAYKRLKCAPQQHVTLVDMRHTQIQSQEAVTGFADCMADPMTRSRRIAFIISRSLARLQVKRAVGARNAAYFLTEEEARAWLLSDQAAAA
jgi:hypothetical protein